MKTSLLILACFCLGILCGRFGLLPESLDGENVTLILLFVLMSCVGISVGSDRRLGEILRSLRPKILLYPLGTTIGTFLAAGLCSLFLAYPLSHCLAVGAGFAYYSLSSILITQAVGTELGTVAPISKRQKNPPGMPGGMRPIQTVREVSLAPLSYTEIPGSRPARIP